MIMRYVSTISYYVGIVAKCTVLSRVVMSVVD